MGADVVGKAGVGDGAPGEVEEGTPLPGWDKSAVSPLMLVE